MQEHLLDPERRRKLSVQIRSSKMGENGNLNSNGHSEASSVEASEPAGGGGARPNGKGSAKQRASVPVETITDLWAFKRRQEAYGSL